MIEAVWHTARLRVSTSSEEDLPGLERVFKSNYGTLLLEGIAQPDPKELAHWLSEGSLPPGGRKERHRLQTITRCADNEVIGYLSIYHGYPDPGTVYIGTLSVRRDCQNQGFGGEIVERLASLPGLSAYSSYRLIVTVRNWDAVRFWTRHSFTQVVQVLGHLSVGDGSGAKLELVRRISRNACPAV